jgi:flagellar FlgN protein
VMSPEALAVQPAPTPASHVGSLTAALDTERRLLDELARVLQGQRDGVSTNDLTLLDDSVYAAQRIFHTLHEAREQRRILLQLIGAQDGASLTDLESSLGRWASPEVVTARDSLMVSARALAREVDMNRRILDGAMAMGDELIRAFSGASAPAPVYGPGEASDSGGSSGALLNTRV